MKNKVYLNNVKLEDALEIVKSKLDLKPSFEIIDVRDSLGTFTYESVYSKISNPFYNCSAMDGIAVRYIDTINASENNPVFLKEDKDYYVLDTGDPIKEGFDAVIMIEDIIPTDDSTFKIINPVKKYENVRLIGEDIIEDTLLLTKNHKIRSVDVAAMLASGVSYVKVYKKISVGIIPTGTEIVNLNDNLKVGDIIEFNSKMIEGEILSLGCKAKIYDIVIDDYDLIKKQMIIAAKENDVVIVNAGSSAGREDFTSSVIEEIGDVFVHGIAIKPGKPTIIGQIQNKCVIGVPGYPVSAYIVIKSIVEKILENMYYKENKENKIIDAKLSKRLMSSLKYKEFVRSKLMYVNGEFLALPLSKNAGSMSSIVNADGIIIVDQNTEGIEKGETVKVNLISDINQIKNTIIHSGSHDPCLDIIRNMLRDKNKYFLSTSNVGSVGGILSLKNNECDFTTIHLLDTESGKYNESYVEKYLNNEDYVLKKFLKREQGIICRKENSEILKSIQDIKDKKFVFGNRQKGSGTRILFDYMLKELNILEKDIIGYENQEFTHFGIANGVLNKIYDAGIGVYSAAKAKNLEFIKIGYEEYDLLFHKNFLESEKYKEMLKIIESDEFKSEVYKMGGYEVI